MTAINDRLKPLGQRATRSSSLVSPTLFHIGKTTETDNVGAPAAVTPQAMNHANVGPDCKIVKLSDPGRNQGASRGASIVLRRLTEIRLYLYIKTGVLAFSS
jgi:hypothetical protein